LRKTDLIGCSKQSIKSELDESSDNECEARNESKVEEGVSLGSLSHNRNLKPFFYIVVYVFCYHSITFRSIRFRGR